MYSKQWALSNAVSI